MTSTVPRRQIEEIIALHGREPSLREVVVEGASDKRFFEWFLGGNGLPDIPVFEVSTIEVPSVLVAGMGLDDGNRGRVITLAAALAAGGPARGVTCVADADFDWLLNVRSDCPVLLLTDFACLEAYAFNINAIQKIIKLVLDGLDKDAQTVLEQIAGLLQELFLLRAANHVAKLGLDFQGPNASGFSKSVRLTESGLAFDADKYLRVLLQARGIAKNKTEVLAIVGRTAQVAQGRSAIPDQWARF
jgi:hypothetical protein